MSRSGAALAALIAALVAAPPPDAGAWEIGGAPQAASTIVGDYIEAGLLPETAKDVPASAGGDAPVLHDEAGSCAPGAAEPCEARRRIVFDRDRPLEPPAVGALLGRTAGEPGLASIEPSTLLDQTPVYAPDVGATRWQTVLFSIEGMTRLGPKPLESAGRVRDTAAFIRALLQPIAVIAFLVAFFCASILVFKRQPAR